MPKFEVRYSEAAESQLTAIWLEFPSKELTAAVRAIDHRLAHAADVIGEPRFGTARILVAQGLAFHFEVNVDAGTAVVLDVKHLAKISRD